MTARQVRRVHSALYLDPYCGCQLAPVTGWWIAGHGVIECLLCGVAWTEIYPDEARP